MVVLLALVHVPLGTWIHRVFTDDRDLRVERAIYRLIGVDPAPTSAGRSTRSPSSPSPSSRSSRCSCSSMCRPTCRSRWAGRWTWTRAQHRGLVRDQHQLAVVLRRGALGYTRPDGRAGRAELRLRRRRDRRRGRPDPRPRPPQHRPARQLLGRPGPRHRPDPAAARRRRRPRADRRRGRPELRRPDDDHDARRAARRSSRRPGRLPGGHQGARHQRRRLLQRQLRAPVREPQRADQPVRDLPAPGHPVRLPRTFGRMVGDRRQGYAIARRRWRPARRSAGARRPGPSSRRRRAAAAGARWRARRSASASAWSALFAAATTGTSTGAVNSLHDCYTALGGGVAAVQHDARRGRARRRRLRALRDARARDHHGVHRRPDGRPDPEYLGKKIGRARDQAASRSTSSPRPALVLVGTALAMVAARPRRPRCSTSGPHGLSEVLYAFTSAANNNGSAFAGLTATTPFYNTRPRRS